MKIVGDKPENNAGGKIVLTDLNDEQFFAVMDELQNLFTLLRSLEGIE